MFGKIKTQAYSKDIQYYRFCSYGLFKNLRFFDPFLLLFLLDKLNQDYVLAMSLYSVRFIIRTLLEIPSGILADALGRKGSLLFAYSFYIVSFIAYYFSANYILLLIPTLLFGIGDAFRTGTHKAMILDYLKQNNWQNAKTEYYGNTRSWSQAGSAVSSLIAAVFVLLNGNYEIIFLATIVPYLIGFALLIGYPKNLNKKFGHNSHTRTNISNSIKMSFHSLKRKKSLSILSNTSFYFGFHNAIKDLLQPIIVSALLALPWSISTDINKKSSIAIGLFYFLIYILSTIASRRAKKATKYFRSTAQAINTLTIMGVTIVLLISILLFLDFPLIAALVFVPFFPILSFQRPSSINYVAETVDEKIMATTLSVESQIGSLTAAIFSFLAGILIKNFGLGLGLGLLSLLALLIAFLFTIKKHEKNNS